MAAPAYASTGTLLSGADSTAANFPVPSGVTSGAFVMVFMWLEDLVTATPPAGAGTWTEIGNVGGGSTPPAAVSTNAGQSTTVRVFWKYATGSDAGTYNFTLSGSPGWRTGFSMRFTGVAASSPIDAQSGSNGDFLQTTAPAVSLTTTDTDRLLVYFMANWNGGGTQTVPSGFVSRASGSADVGISISDKTQAAAGSTGTVQGSWASTGGLTAYLVALKPTGGAAATSLVPPRRLGYGSLFQY